MSKRTVVCSRINHPKGYGHQLYGTAHGFVTLIVTNVKHKNLDKLVDRLHKPVHEVFTQGGQNSWWGEWYGGLFNIVSVIGGYPVLPADLPYSTGISYTLPEKYVVRSLGDNRAVAIVTYKQLMESDLVE